MRVDFYHLTLVPAEKALPRLLEKPYRAGLRVLTLVRDTEEKQRLDSSFWSYTTKFFLPHGTDDGIKPERQPILISERLSTQNTPTVIASAGRTVALADMPKGCERMLYMFDGNDPAALSDARLYWKECDGAERRYFFQDKQSGWETEIVQVFFGVRSDNFLVSFRDLVTRPNPWTIATPRDH